MIEKKDRKAGQLYALDTMSHHLVFCIKAGELAVVRILWPSMSDVHHRIVKINWDRVVPASDQYPSKHEIAKMIFGEV